MSRFRSLAALLVATGLTLMPVLRSACDLDCADPPPVSTAAEPHCPQHPDAGAPSQPVRNGDACGHNHQAHRMLAAGTIKYDASTTSILLPPTAAVTFDPIASPLVRITSSPPLVRPVAAAAPLRL